MNNKQAFTLIEVLVSVVIIAIGFAGVYSLITTSNRVMNDSIDREKSNYHASEIIETLHSERKNLSSVASISTKVKAFLFGNIKYPLNNNCILIALTT